MTACWYRVPEYIGATPLIPSQQCSLSGRRTAFTRQLLSAAIDAVSLGPSKMPQPWTQGYAGSARLTPRSVRGWPSAFTSSLRWTRSALAGVGSGVGLDVPSVGVGSVVASDAIAGRLTDDIASADPSTPRAPPLEDDTSHVPMTSAMATGTARAAVPFGLRIWIVERVGQAH